MTKILNSVLALVILVPAFSAHGLTVREQSLQSFDRLESNLDDTEIMPGAVIASPSQNDPNYFFHWIRDAALVMETYVNVGDAKADLADYRMERWLAFETRLQNVSKSSAGLGEPKYNIDGSLFTGPWGRPQNDGPALRARTLMLWASRLNDGGSQDYVRKVLLSKNSVIRKDLTYSMNHWKEASFDVWEEVKGDHFFTRLAQLRSLQLGADLFQDIDKAFADKLTATANLLDQDMNSFWSDSQNIIVPTINQTDGWTHKKSNLDLTVLLASLYFTGEGDEFGISDDRIISTMKQLKDSFRFYEINHGNEITLLGRYQEDVYDGNGFGGGNPWFLANTGYAQAQCRLAHEWAQQDIEISDLNRAFLMEYLPNPLHLTSGETLKVSDPRHATLVKNLKVKAMKYFQQVNAHAGTDGQMDEQFSRYNGYMRGARDLSWSHASYIRAVGECRNVMNLGI